MNKDLFITIHDWMLDILKGNDLLVFALIYSLGEVTSQRYIAERTRLSIWSVSRSIQNLEEKKLIVRSHQGTGNLTVFKLAETANSKLQKPQVQVAETASSSCRNRKFEVAESASSFLYNTNNNMNSNTNTNTNHQVIAVVLSSLSVESDDESMRSLCTSIDGFIEHRKKLKKPMTEHALELSIKRAHQLSNGDVKGMTELFDLAVEKGWQGIYPSKDKKEGEKNDTGKHERFFK